MDTSRTERRLGVLESVGREILGPVLVRFARWHLDLARERDVSVLLYIAREGRLLRDVANVAFPPAKGDPPREYALLSRRIAWGCRTVPPSRMFVPRVGRSRIRTVRAALDTVPLSVDLKATLLAHADLELDASLDRDALDRLAAAVHTHRDAVARDVGDQRGRLRRYLLGLGVDPAGRTGVVDVGWSATIQDAVRAVLDPEASLHGFYLGLHRSAKVADDCTKAGFVLDPTHRDHGVPLVTAGGALRLLEALLSNAERSAYRLYDAPGGDVAVELAPYGPSEHSVVARAAIHRGVLATAEAMRGAFPDGAGLQPGFHLDSAAALRELLGRPSRDLADALLDMTYVQDVGVGVEEPIGWRGVRAGTAWFPGLAAMSRVPGAARAASVALEAFFALGGRRRG